LPEKRRQYSPEFREEAVKMVIEESRPIAAVARQLGVYEATLGNWVHRYRRAHTGEPPTPSAAENARLRELERENRDLRMEVEFLKKAAAYFAQDRR
jgi:transposase